MQNFIKINDNDNVIVALNTIPAGTEITLENGTTVTSNMEIPAGQKWQSAISLKAPKLSTTATALVSQKEL